MFTGFDLAKYLTEHRLTSLSRKTLSEVYSTTLTTSDSNFDEIEDFVFSNIHYQNLTREELLDKVQEYDAGWNNVKDNYLSVEQYLADIEQSGKYL